MILLYICVVIITDLVFATTANLLDMDLSTSEVELHHQQRYTKLLNTIVKLNERRLDAMKTLARLDDADPAMKSSFQDFDDRREIENDLEDIDDSSNFLGFMVLQKKPALRTKNNQLTTTAKTSQIKKKYVQSKKRKEPKVESPLVALDTEIKKNDTECYIAAESKSILRKRWDKSCQKKASKVCKKACVDATKNTCSYTSCSSKEKKNLKRECKTECKARFLHD